MNLWHRTPNSQLPTPNFKVMTSTVRVGMSQLAVARAPDKIETQALGSCVGVVLYDASTKIGGMSHAMLPDVMDASMSSRVNPAKFVNTAIEILISKMIEMGANTKSIKAKLAGGANMFPDIVRNDESSVGVRNVEAARRTLKAYGIEIVAEEVGGTFSRTIVLDTKTGKLRVRTIACGEKEI